MNLKFSPEITTWIQKSIYLSIFYYDIFSIAPLSYGLSLLIVSSNRSPFLLKWSPLFDILFILYMLISLAPFGSPFVIRRKWFEEDCDFVDGVEWLMIHSDAARFPRDQSLLKNNISLFIWDVFHLKKKPTRCLLLCFSHTTTMTYSSEIY